MRTKLLASVLLLLIALLTYLALQHPTIDTSSYTQLNLPNRTAKDMYLSEGDWTWNGSWHYKTENTTKHWTASDAQDYVRQKRWKNGWVWENGSWQYKTWEQMRGRDPDVLNSCTEGPAFLSLLDRGVAVCKVSLNTSLPFNFSSHYSYCGNWNVPEPSAFVVLDGGEFHIFPSAQELRSYLAPVENEEQAAAFALLELNTADYDQVFVRESPAGYEVKLVEGPSDCSCGWVWSYECDYLVGRDGSVRLLDRQPLKRSYHPVCIG